jgi:hypothetical protein
VAPRSEIKLRILRREEVREYINETDYIDFEAVYWNDGDVSWFNRSFGILPRREFVSIKEPPEKWKSEEQARIEKLRDRIKFQAEARMNKEKVSK